MRIVRQGGKTAGRGAVLWIVPAAVLVSFSPAATEEDESRELDPVDWAREVETSERNWNVFYELVPRPPRPGTVFYLLGQMKENDEHTHFAAYLEPQVERTAAEIEARFGKPDEVRKKHDRLFRYIHNRKPGGAPRSGSVEGEYRRYGLVSFMSQGGAIRYIWVRGTNVYDRIQAPRGDSRTAPGKGKAGPASSKPEGGAPAGTSGSRDQGGARAPQGSGPRP